MEPAADSDINCPITQFTQFAQRLELFYSIFRDSTDLGQKPHGLRRISLRPYLLLTWPYDQPTNKMNNGKVFVCSKDKVLLSDLLFSIYNGFLTQTKNRVIEANSNFYDEPTIWTEKLRFFESIGKAAKPRRQTQISDASSKHIDDIFVEIESRDASGTFLPVSNYGKPKISSQRILEVSKAVLHPASHGTQCDGLGNSI